MCNANALGVPIEEYVHYTHGPRTRTGQGRQLGDLSGFCQEEFIDHCLFHEYDAVVCHIVSADDVEIDDTLIRELKGYDLRGRGSCHDADRDREAGQPTGAL